MPSKKQLILLIITLVAGLTIIFLTTKRENITTITLPNGQVINAELADTQTKRTVGLMFRKQLDQNTGMLFIFDDISKHVFWMKNTLIPLDILWLDENLKVVHISKNTPPCKSGEKCPLYLPDAPAKYVLELNAGYVDYNGLKVGDTFILEKN